jgi:SAM-dependent methyltransferase
MTQSEFTNREIIEMWAAHAEEAVASFEQDGDFARRHLLNPTILSLLGSIAGKSVLDAGCGNGYLSRMLAAQGAIVTGVEPALIDLCRSATDLDSDVTYVQEDLSTLLDTRPEMANAYDIVVSNLVLQDIPDGSTAIHNCARTLKRGGSFVLSITHPCFEESAGAWLEKGFVAVHDYFESKAIPQTRFGVRFHRPLSFYFNSLVESGCNIVRIVEPQLGTDTPIPGSENQRDRYVPSFLVIRAVRARSELLSPC